MSDQINIWTKKIDQLTREYLAAVSPLSAEQINTRPAPDSWSTGEILQHIILVNQSYIPGFQNARSGQQDLPFTARIKFLVRFFGKTILNSVDPQNMQPTKTFAIWQPQQTNVNENILQQFQDSQAELTALVRSSREQIISGTVISSPANRYIVYTLRDMVEIILAHEERHLQQVVKTKQALLDVK